MSDSLIKYNPILGAVALPYSDKVTELKKLAKAEMSKFGRYDNPTFNDFKYLSDIEKLFNSLITSANAEWVRIYGRTKIINRSLNNSEYGYQHYIENDRVELSNHFIRNVEDYVKSNYKHILKAIEKAESLGLWEVRNISKDENAWVEHLQLKSPAYITFYLYVCTEVKYNWQFTEMLDQYLQENMPISKYSRPE